jgi:hypothetical protein
MADGGSGVRARHFLHRRSLNAVESWYRAAASNTGRSGELYEVRVRGVR